MNYIKSSDISIITCVWGNYWEKFGQNFIESIKKLKNSPGQILIGSQQKINLDKRFHQYKISPPFKWDAWNQVICRAEKKWIFPIAIDDLLLPDALENFETNSEIIRFPYITSDNNLLYPNPGEYEVSFDLSKYATPGGMLVKKNIIKKIPIRNSFYSDWMQSLEFYANNIKVDFDFKVRVKHQIHSEQHSNKLNINGIEQIEEFKKIFNYSKVRPGNEWPPKTSFKLNCAFLKNLYMKLLSFLSFFEKSKDF